MKTNLYLSPKFANALRRIGLLEPLIYELKKFEEKENYPFELEQMRIIKQTVFKSLCDYYGKTGKKPSIEEILEKTEKISERLYGPKISVSEEIVKEITEDFEKQKKKNEQ